MKSNDIKPLDSFKRLASMIIDYIFMIIIFAAFFLPFVQSMIESSRSNIEIDLFTNNSIYFGAIGMTLLLCKDICGGQSLSKRIFKLVVIDNVTGKVATPMKCFIRNLTFLIWPVEVILTLINPERRLGDKIAGTKIANFDNENIEKPKLNGLSLIVAFAVAYLFTILLFFLWNQILP